MSKESLRLYDIIAEAGVVATYAWNHHICNPRFVRNFLLKDTVEGSDPIKFIPAKTSSRTLRSVIIENDGKKLTFDQELKGVLINPIRRTFTVYFVSEAGIIDHATYSHSSKLYMLFQNSAMQKAA